MSGGMLQRTLADPAMLSLFSDRSLIAAMCAFEAALAEAEAAEGVIPAAAPAAITAACAASFDADAIEAMVDAARGAGSLAIPFVKQLRDRVAAADPRAAGFVHWGSTSQDVIDTGLVLVTRQALARIDADLAGLIGALLALARRHRETPMLARTLLQPAQVISVGFKLVAWMAPLLRARDRLARAGIEALRLQLGGAVGTLATLGDAGPAVARRVAQRLGLSGDLAAGAAEGAWHVQRDAWVALGCELAVLAGSLGKIGRDLALLGQAEVGEMREAAAAGRGGSSAMPNKRNPVAALVAIAAATRAPHLAATLLAALPQEHERGLGGWQAEIAVWPELVVSVHGALSALAGVASSLEVDAARMRANVEAQRGAVFAEAAAAVVARAVGRSRADELLARLSQQAAAGGELQPLLRAALAADASLAGVDQAAVGEAFDIDAAARRTGVLAAKQLDALQAAFDARPQGDSA